MQEAMQLQIMNLTTMPVPSKAASQTLAPPVATSKTFGMAKWRASQKARRQLATIEADCNRKPYHFDEGSIFGRQKKLDSNHMFTYRNVAVRRSLLYELQR